MECNKDEAFRSKGIAEKKFLQHDFVGAMKFAHKAKQLFPDLEGIPQFIAVLDVHIVAENKLHSGETNWYGILQVDPSADDNTIRKQYRKLALLLHPDKNKSLGAEAAFKHLSEAWAVLSDKLKKAAFDMRCNGKMSASQSARQKESTNVSSHSNKPQQQPPDVPPSFASQPRSKAQHQKAQTQGQQAQSVPSPAQSEPPPPQTPAQTHKPWPPHVPNTATFWTSCPSCKMQLEYQKIYLRKMLCCPICHKPFLGNEVMPVGGTLVWPPPQAEPGFRVGVQASDIKGTSFMNHTFNYMPSGSGNSGPAHPLHNDSAQEVPEVLNRKGTTENIKVFKKERTNDKSNVKKQTQEVVSPAKKQIPEVVSPSKKHTPEVVIPAKKQTPEVVSPTKKRTSEALSPKSLDKKGRGKQRKLKEEIRAKDAAHAKEFFDRLIKGVIEQQLSTGKEKQVAGGDKGEFLKSDKGIAVESSGEPASCKSGGCTNLNVGTRDRSNQTQEANGHGETRKQQGLRGPSTRAKRTVDMLPKDEHKGYLPAKRVKEESLNSLSDGNVHKSGDNFVGNSSDALNLNEVVNDSSKLPKQEKSFSELPKQETLSSELPKQEESRSELPKQEESCSNLAKQEKPSPKLHKQGKSSPKSPKHKVDEVISVPDPEFYEFDKDRTENHFSPGQIWAAYDENDGMPRYYARVNKVLSSEPFKIQISWLEPRSPDAEALALIKSGLSITSGDFKLGRIVVSEHINTYSHLMNFDKGQRGGYKIYPRKGDIWALYENWRSSLSKKNRKTGYVMVEILTDFDIHNGVQVLKLVKLDRFKTLFQKQECVESISCEDLRRFSHRVPAFCLKAGQAPGISESCWELDPAATPLDLVT